ncbi:hypothetical protein K438DRAFT_226038 [Mycena galopus ATCC 62051]|nr:hypothetical protein K438DRAFT_226038 [Mycena galopus ATCC 62051]
MQERDSAASSSSTPIGGGVGELVRMHRTTGRGRRRRIGTRGYPQLLPFPDNSPYVSPSLKCWDGHDLYLCPSILHCVAFLEVLGWPRFVFVPQHITPSHPPPARLFMPMASYLTGILYHVPTYRPQYYFFSSIQARNPVLPLCESVTNPTYYYGSKSPILSQPPRAVHFIYEVLTFWLTQPVPSPNIICLFFVVLVPLSPCTTPSCTDLTSAM